MRLTVLLPMKGHSERVPNKNMKEFAGKPLYHAVMQSLQKSNCVEKIVINTDSSIITEDALANFEKVRILDRPKEIQGDFKIATVDATGIAIRHTLGTKAAPIVNTAILGAFAKVTGLVKIESIVDSIKTKAPLKKDENAEAAVEAYDNVNI